MRTFQSFSSFGAFLLDVARIEEETLSIGVDRCLEKCKIEAAQRFGVYQSGWAPLAESTLETHAKFGMGDTPLLLTGKLVGSIRKKKYGPLSGWTGIEGPEGAIMSYQEFGTSRGIPPRPVFGPTLEENREFILQTLGKAAFSAFTWHGAGGGWELISTPTAAHAMFQQYASP